MAHTKQMPRNPTLERPTTAMGSDVQPERRVPLKPTSKKITTKGGKQPQKHLLQILCRFLILLVELKYSCDLWNST